MMDPAITIPDTAWREGSPGHLLTTIVINCTPLHLQAFEIRTGRTGKRLADQSTVFADADTAAIHAAIGADGPWETTVIRGKPHVLIATPYCD